MKVNAAIECTIEAGATEFLVVDGHGLGAICQELLHPEARLLIGRPRSYPNPTGIENFSCAMIVGQHAKAGTPGGHLSHTQSLIVSNLALNGVSLGELGWDMLLASYFNVPTVLVTGDEAACLEAKELVPQIQVAAVKKGISWGAAVHLHPEKARVLIREQAKEAVRRQREIPCFNLAPPYSRQVDYYGTADVPINTKKDNADDLLELLNQKQ